MAGEGKENYGAPKEFRDLHFLVNSVSMQKYPFST
jgi:hypothetical protein